MKRFDCLAESCPLFGPHLLEASAGTGKTFSIEHIFVRLLLQSIQIEEILVVTFTKAATRELKERIRACIEKARSSLEKPEWPYLKPFAGSEEAVKILSDALSVFDRSQIFTIHGFCYRMLKEFAFEAQLGFSLPDPDGEKNLSKKIRRSLSEFFEKGIDSQLLCPEQISVVMDKHGSLEEISRRLVRSQRQQGISLSEYHRRFSVALNHWIGAPISAPLLLEDFERARINYRKKEGNFSIQINHLAACFQKPEELSPFSKLLWDRGSLFSFLAPANKKVKPKEIPPLHYPGFFDWCAEHLAPVVFDAVDLDQIFSTLVSAWKVWEEKFLEGEDLLQPDEILLRMRRAIDIPSFNAQLRGRYQAAIVDEFQDTDPLQWEIFRKLFLEEPIRALYLVGDPKQSIYRFRNADVYTYFSARDFLGEENLYHLDTNFRSSKELIGSLNALFNRKWLPLPKIGQEISCLPVRAGSGISSQLGDGKGALHWIAGDENASFKETFLPYTVQEIERLSPSSLSSIAILVKDRYEAEEALQCLRERGIPAVAKSHQPLGQTLAFRSVRELLKAVISPHDESLEKIVQAGPFERSKPEFSQWKSLLEEKGLVPFFRQFLSGRETPFEADLRQVLEVLFSWEQKEGFSFEGLSRFLEEFERLDADEGGRRRMDGVEDSVQILTLHISKGLEFDIVFALGAASKSPEKGEAEADAEKLRQLYVAMTRAKKRLYVPVKQLGSKRSFSPMELFISGIEGEEGPFLPYLRKLAESESLSFEEVSTPFILPPKRVEKKSIFARETPPRVAYTPSYIHSFTSLANPTARQGEKIESERGEEYTLQTLPRGAETGTVVHQIFESLFSSPTPVWRDERAIDRIVEKELRFSPLSPWMKPMQEMVRKTVSQTLFDGERNFSLKDLDPGEIFVEMEFLYAQKGHFVKGFIDLVFCREEKFYLLDWKTTWLKEPSPNEMKEAMQAHDYELQAALYAEALRRHLGSAGPFEERFGGAFYLFVRSGAYLHFKPDLSRLERCYGK